MLEWGFIPHETFRYRINSVSLSFAIHSFSSREIGFEKSAERSDFEVSCVFTHIVFQQRAAIYLIVFGQFELLIEYLIKPIDIDSLG